MRDRGIRVSLLVIAALSLAGCATMSGGGDDAKAPDESSTASTSAEAKPAAASEKTAAAKPSAESERAAPAASSRDTARNDDANSTARLVTQLNEATREIATLRAANAKLRAGGPASSATATRERAPDPADEKLTASFKSYAQFKQELTAFFTEIDKLRAENASLNAKLKDASSGSQDVKATLAKLETELKSEKAARAQAEQTTAKLREQLRAVAAAVSGGGLTVDKTSSSSSAAARLETSEARLRGSAAPVARKHVVKEGETLERIADRYYGDSTKWRAIFDANRSRLPLDGTLPTGLELEIPPAK